MDEINKQIVTDSVDIVVSAVSGLNIAWGLGINGNKWG